MAFVINVTIIKAVESLITKLKKLKLFNFHVIFEEQARLCK